MSTTTPIIWTCKRMQELTHDELYTILKLRSEVFIVEQNCVYLDPDGKDQNAWHLCGWLNGELLVAYARLLAPGVSYDQASIGRVLTSAAHRKDGYGKLLMQKAIQYSKEKFDTKSIKIGAQEYLIKFYSSFGFNITSEPYIEDGIPHVEMLLGK
ncbi:MAG: GNAT family N-acetyltransferase [Chitinophagaceae bacterium]|nr:MAG: GNAT family N-acetyltransferase [Chitinophagaceae bacterium]